MTSFNQPSWRGDPNTPEPPHPRLAREAEQEALNAPWAVPRCECDCPDGRGKTEYYPEYCELHRDAYLAEVAAGALDDDKRETPGQVAS